MLLPSYTSMNRTYEGWNFHQKNSNSSQLKVLICYFLYFKKIQRWGTSARSRYNTFLGNKTNKNWRHQLEVLSIYWIESHQSDNSLTAASPALRSRSVPCGGGLPRWPSSASRPYPYTKRQLFSRLIRLYIMINGARNSGPFGWKI